MTDRPFHYAFQVRLHDTDAAGRLFFAHLFRYAQDALEALMEDIGYPIHAMIRDGEILLPLTHAEADYRHPMRHGDRIRVEVQVEDLRRRSFAIGYRFLSEAGEELATARTIHVLVTDEVHVGESLPEALRAGLAGYVMDRTQKTP
ncbi:acyl-CoA thioesterase [Thermochromatium tepidum]|uniref:Acyl-CoA thioesterase n=1 Tax=Thermochromatium tepidum ATCC 43061 TaxID=316276 RepID=A0A6I6DY22_THETI|nr:acyl-CoA thioesterase [Thermochromatium tepidum]QGU32464.1 acyl-CoA thioesterase [Thermochromatium tepidum ATCC 43061]